MSKIINKIVVLLLLLLPTFIFPAAAIDNLSDQLTYSDNKDGQNYSWNWTSPVYSYLVKTEDGYQRIEYDPYGNEDNCLIITDFDNQFNPTDEKTLEIELPLFGGFYEGKDNYYVVAGQNNPEEDDNCEVIRVVKYDKNWKRLGKASLNGANTYIPFDAGSLRMAESNNYLYVRTSHEMYESGDGLHHQSNLTMKISIPDMEMIDANYDVSNSSTGYVSHSFNQFIIIDGDDIVALDHGDAYPRAALLGKYSAKADDEGRALWSYFSTKLMEYPGETGDNYTYASLGGLEASADNYLTVGNYTVNADTGSQTRNVYLTVTPKSNVGEQENLTKTIWLTTLKEDSGRTTKTPHLVKYDNNTFAVLWSESNFRDPYDEKTYCVFVNGNGKTISGPKEIEADLSDCHPIVDGNTATWYVTTKADSYSQDHTNFTSYRLSKNGSINSTTWIKPEPATDLQITPESVVLIPSSDTGSKQLEVTVTPRNTTDEITFESENPGIANVDQNGLITAISGGTTKVNVRAGNIEKSVNVEVRIPSSPSTPTDPTPQTPSDSSGTVNIYRLYNTQNGEHLYTTDANEVRTLVSTGIWNDEGIGWKAPASGDPVYRLYNAQLQNHLYTTDMNEALTLWLFEGWDVDNDGYPLFYSGGSVPIYRVYNRELRGLHHLTTDFNEYSVLPSVGWTQEGIALYAASAN